MAEEADEGINDREQDDWGKKMENKKIDLKNDNRGVSMVMVIVVLGFVALLLSMLTYMSLYNFQMRAADYKSQNTFYSAEMAMDEIKAGLETKISTAVSKSYLDVMQNYSTYTDKQRASRFQYVFFNYLNGAHDSRDSSGSGLASSTAGLYNVDMLRGFLTKDTSIVNVTTAESEAVMVTYTDHITLENIEVTYEDPNNQNISIIKTDINLLMPNLSFNEQLVLPEMVDYALIANNGLVVNSNSMISSAKIYAGPIDEDEDAITIKNGSLTLNKCGYVVSGGQTALIGSQAYIKADEDTNLWTQGILVDTPVPTGYAYNLYLPGSTYVHDDLTISGNLSSIFLAGSYYGYGQGKSGDSEQNSAILLNGYHTKLNFSGLNQLALAGTAYIGLSKDTNKDSADDFAVFPKASETSNAAAALSSSKDVKIGGSLSTKADQIAFLVPPECIGWSKTDGKATTCVIGKNPVSVSEYNRYLSNYAKDKLATADNIEEVYLDKTIKMLGKSLSDYGLDEENPYYVVIPQGTNWRYYYLNFASEKDAGNFFRDYYAADFTRLDKYIDNYISEFHLSDNLKKIRGTVGGFRLNLAGNLIYLNPDYTEGGTLPKYLMLKPDENNAETQLLLGSEYNMYGETYDSLCRILSPDHSIMTTQQASQDVFDNLILSDKLSEVCSGSSVTFQNALGENKVYVTTANVSVSALDKDIALIISTADVTVDTSFSGTILTDGKITITNGDISSNPDDVSSCLNLPKNINGTDVSVANLFVEGKNFTAISSEKSSDSSATVSADTLITYSNWEKR